MQVQFWPVTAGINGHIDARLLPDGALADAVNVELDRQGRLIGRAKYTAQATTVYGTGTLVAYDLFTLNDRLFSLGDAHSYGYACDIYEFMPDGLAARWRPTSNRNATSPRLPRATKVRELVRPPDQAGGVHNMSCAAFDGLVALAWNPDDDREDSYASIVSAADNQPVVFQRLADTADTPRSRIRALALEDRFIFLGEASTATDLEAARFIPASDESVVAVSTLYSGDNTTYAACRVTGANEFVTAVNVSGTVTIRRWNASCVQQGSDITISANAGHIALEADDDADQLVVLLNVSGTVTAYGYTLSTGSAIGNAAAFTGETCSEIGLCRVSSTVVQAVASVSTETAPTVMSNRYTVSTSTFAGVVNAVTDAKLATTPVFSDETFFGIRVGDDGLGGTPNMIVSSGTDDEDVTPQICKDLEVAGTTVTGSTLLPDLTRDADTGKYYWCNATANPDNDFAPGVTEFELDSTDRRQVTEFGNHVYISGGCPLVFDGHSVVEMGFLTRPRIVSVQTTTGSGSLLGGAEYDWRLHHEWVDSNQDLHLSAASAIKSATLTSANNQAGAVVASPISMRRNGSANDRGGVVRNVLSRTLATVSRTAAVITGAKVVDPPSSSLNALVLNIFVEDDTASQLFVVTFDSGSTTASAIVTDINAVTTGRVTASAVGGAIRLTLDDTGEGNHLWIYPGTANAILGFADNSHEEGTTTFTKGENFQRTASSYTAADDAVAAYDAITDTRKDESSPIVDTDLIRQQVLYSQGIASGSHHSPPPCEYIWAGRERVWFMGQPNRGRVTASKLLVPGETAECAFAGFLGFSQQVSGDVEAGAVIGDALALWTRRQIWLVTGSGPARNGIGEFFAPQCLSHAVGIKEDGWRSLVQDDFGVWFQGSDDELYRLSRAGQIENLGEQVQDYLDDYPVVTAALYVRSKQEVAFAVQSTSGSTGGILRYQARAQAWFFDDVGAVSSMADYQGRIAYVQSGTVYIQDAAPGVGTFVAYNVTGNMFQGFGVLGYGQVHRVGGLFTWRGPCTAEVFFSTDGEDFSQSLGSWSLTDSDYDEGDRVRLLVQPPEDFHDSFALKVAITHDGTDSEGAWFHGLVTETERAPNLVRLGPTHTL